MAVLGRLCLGMVVDPLNPRALLTIIQTDTAPILFVACAVFGLSIGNLITLPPLIIHRKFDAAAFTRVMGLSYRGGRPVLLVCRSLFRTTNAELWLPSFQSLEDSDPIAKRTTSGTMCHPCLRPLK